MTTPADPGVLALDELSRTLLAAARDLRVAVAATPVERRAAERLRFRQVVEEGWAAAGDLPGSLEHDAFDATALQVAAWAGDDLAGTMRMVLPARGRPLPVESAFGVTVEPAGRVVEAGRLVVAPEHRGDPGHHIWGALFARAWLEVRGRGFCVLAGAAAPEMVDRLREMGLSVEVLAPARLHWGRRRHPVRVDPAASRPAWLERRGRALHGSP